MNLVPHTWLLRIYSQHYHAVCPLPPLCIGRILCAYRRLARRKREKKREYSFQTNIPSFFGDLPIYSIILLHDALETQETFPVFHDSAYEQ